MDIFEYAMQMETDAEDYYRSLAAQTGNKGLKTSLSLCPAPKPGWRMPNSTIWRSTKTPRCSKPLGHREG